MGLIHLQNRVKWHQQQLNVEDEDLVVVIENYLPPQKWLIGEIIGNRLGNLLELHCYCTVVSLMRSTIKLPFVFPEFAPSPPTFVRLGSEYN